MTDSNIIIDKVTRGSIDGGRDAIGRIKLGVDSDPIYAEFAIEAKCKTISTFFKSFDSISIMFFLIIFKFLCLFNLFPNHIVSMAIIL